MKKELISQESPKSPIAETFRTLRQTYSYNSQKDLKTILITSTMPGEGKVGYPLTSCNFCTSRQESCIS